jgi:hypothetical protein
LTIVRSAVWVGDRLGLRGLILVSELGRQRDGDLTLLDSSNEPLVPFAPSFAAFVILRVETLAILAASAWEKFGFCADLTGLPIFRLVIHIPTTAR